MMHGQTQIKFTNQFKIFYILPTKRIKYSVPFSKQTACISAYTYY